MITKNDGYTVKESVTNGRISVTVGEIEHFDVSQIFDCGQSFRFLPLDFAKHVGGVAFGRYVEFLQSDDTLTIIGADKSEFDEIWKHYLALDMDYAQVKRELESSFDGKDPQGVLERAMKLGCGIRLLRQEPWECLCSFVISQNNNIPRIRKIIGALCESLGDPIEVDGRTVYAFPSAETVARAGIEKIFSLGTGFRAKYIIDAAETVASGRLDLNELFKCDTQVACERLCEIRGVGPKVAACTMLFSLEKYDAFPIDVWVKRILEKYFPCGLDVDSLGRFAGIAQQYLFYYERYNVGKRDLVTC